MTTSVPRLAALVTSATENGADDSWSADTWVALAACLVAFIAVVPAVVSTWFARTAANAAVDQTRLQREIAHEASLPRVWADVRPLPEAKMMLGFMVGNTGATNAHDVRVTISPRLLPGVQHPERVAKAQDAAATGVATLPPGRTYEWTLGVAREVLEANEGVPEHTVTIDARAADGTVLHESYVLRLTDFRSTRGSGGGSLADISEGIKRLTTEVTRTREALTAQPDE